MVVSFLSSLAELSLMFGLMDRIPNGVEPMLLDLESYITQNGVDDMKASAEIITSVSWSLFRWLTRSKYIQVLEAHTHLRLQ